MKNTLILILAFVTINAQAQLQPVLKNKKGIAIHPQQGDYCIGMSVNPFLNYFGNILNNSSSNNSPNVQFANSNQLIYGKYMITNMKAYRGMFRFGINNYSIKTDVTDKTPGALATATVTDVQSYKSTSLGLGFGVEYRKGTSTRLQGIYGYELFVNYNSGSDVTFTYGNKIENEDSGFVRNKKLNNPSNFNIGFRGFVGVEYFIAPKISLGAEFGYGMAISTLGKSEATNETYDKVNSTPITKKTVLSAKRNGFNLDTDNAGGNIKLLLYF